MKSMTRKMKLYSKIKVNKFIFCSVSLENNFFWTLDRLIPIAFDLVGICEKKIHRKSKLYHHEIAFYHKFAFRSHFEWTLKENHMARRIYHTKKSALSKLVFFRSLNQFFPVLRKIRLL